MKQTFRQILLALMLLITASASAQTFYEVTYTDPDDNEKYIGLMIYYGENNCSIRFINNEMLEQNNVAASTYSQVFSAKESSDDVGIMAYAPQEDEFPTFVWMWTEDDASDINEVPFVTFDVNSTEAYFKADAFQEISLEDMDEEYISQFYGEDEEEYQMMVYGANLVDQQAEEVRTSVTPGTGDATIHLILLGNTTIADIGAACKNDIDNMRSEMSGVAKALKMPLREYNITGNSFNKENLVRTIDGLNPSSNDVVVFYYSGHGFRFDDQEDYYPLMSLCATGYEDPTENYFAASDIREVLREKGARLNLVLTDCCNSKIGVDSPWSGSSCLYSRASFNCDINKLRKLFVESQGNIIATASSPGEVAWCGQKGGFFSLNILESLHKQVSAVSKKEPSWETLLNEALANAAEQTEKDASCKRQNGFGNID